MNLPPTDAAAPSTTFGGRVDRHLAEPPSAASARSPTSWWAMVVSAGLGGGLSYVGISMAMDVELARGLVGLPPMQALGFAAGLLLVVWLSLLVHEAGHLLGGWLGNLRPLLLLAGPLRMDLEGGAVRLRYNREASTWGGLAVAVPRQQEVGRTTVALMVAGGPAASVGLALCAWLVPAQGLMVQGWLGFVVLISGAIAVGTLLPMTMGGYVSDGGQLLQLWRGSSDSIHRLQLAAVLGLSAASRRPRDWPLASLSEVAVNAQAPVLRTSALMLCAQHADDGHPEPVEDERHPAYRAFLALAMDLHQGGLAHCPTAFRTAVVLPVAVFLGQRLGDAPAAAAWLKAAEGGFAEPWERQHAQAALAWAQGDVVRAAVLSDQALKVLGERLTDGAKIMARERLLAMRP